MVDEALAITTTQKITKSRHDIAIINTFIPKKASPGRSDCVFHSEFAQDSTVTMMVTSGYKQEKPVSTPARLGNMLVK
jgi:hypothetical protein